MSDEREIQRGVQADALLANDLFREVMNKLDEEYTAAWRAASSVEVREDCHRYTRLIEKLIADIQSVANTGKIAQARVKELQTGKRGFEWPKIT